MVLDHGVKRQLRLMFAALGHQVARLVRIRIGNLARGLPPPGAWRRLSAAEVAALLAEPPGPRRNPRPPRSRKL